MALGKKAFGDIGEPGDCPASSGKLHGIKALESHMPNELFVLISEAATMSADLLLVLLCFFQSEKLMTHSSLERWMARLQARLTGRILSDTQWQ